MALLLPTFVRNGINLVCEVLSSILKGTLVSKPYSSGLSSGHSPRCYQFLKTGRIPWPRSDFKKRAVNLSVGTTATLSVGQLLQDLQNAFNALKEKGGSGRRDERVAKN